jgi:hypothetical protein
MSRARPRAEPAPRRGPFKVEVLDVVDDDLVLVRATGSPTSEVLQAEIAVVGYAPVVGDRALVELVEEGFCIIGVLGEARRRRSRGELVAHRGEDGGVELRFPEGDLTLRAAGRIVLQAAEVETRAEVVHTAAGRVEVEAERIVEHAGDVYRHVEGLAELQAGRARTLVEGALQIAAKRTTVQSEDDTIIDGKRVLLG